MTKAQAQNELDAILAPINNKQDVLSGEWKFGAFVRKVYLPFYRRKWKPSTAATNEDRLKRYLLSEFDEPTLNTFTRDDLQNFLDRKAAANLSFSTVDHLRWDLRQIFAMAVAEGRLARNPAALLFTPKEARHAVTKRMTTEEVRLLFSVLETRELVIAKLAIVAGMRPGEIFGLKWEHVKEDYIHVQQRVYGGKIDSPKTTRSVREVALAEGLQCLMSRWKGMSADSGPSAWVLPSEKLKTFLSKDNCWRRHIGPRLDPVGLDWVNSQAMRRTHSSLMKDNNADPKVVADQLGHSLDVNLNIYTQSALSLRKQAVNALESTLAPTSNPREVSRVM
jgi:integrase